MLVYKAVWVDGEAMSSLLPLPSHALTWYVLDKEVVAHPESMGFFVFLALEDAKDFLWKFETRYMTHKILECDTSDEPVRRPFAIRLLHFSDYWLEGWREVLKALGRPATVTLLPTPRGTYTVMSLIPRREVWRGD